MSKGKLTKAILLNLFIIPGAGHVVFKRKLRGMIFTLITIAVLVIFTIHFSYLINQQLAVVVPQGNDFAELYRMAEFLSKGIMTQNILVIRSYLFLLGVCYIAGITDLVLINMDEKARHPAT